VLRSRRTTKNAKHLAAARRRTTRTRMLWAAIDNAAKQDCAAIEKLTQAISGSWKIRGDNIRKNSFISCSAWRRSVEAISL
jgi:hypothetical protein